VTVALATQQAAPLNPFEPQSMDQAMTLASTLSKSGIIPDSLRGKPADVLVILMTARELGIGPMQGLRGIAVIKGKPVLSADLMVALCLRHRDICEYFRLVESTPAVARYQTKRVGSEPVDLAWSMDDAKRAGLDGGQNWRNHPAAMLRARCGSALARACYPDLVGGIYEESEGEEIAGKVHRQEPVHAEPAPVEVQAEVVVEPPKPPPPPKKANPSAPALALWNEAKREFGEKGVKAKWEAACTEVFGSELRPTYEWTADDASAVHAVMFPPKPAPTDDIAF
jgi:hypothetical protein